MEHWDRVTLRKFSLRIEPAISEVKDECPDYCARTFPFKTCPWNFVPPPPIQTNMKITYKPWSRIALRRTEFCPFPLLPLPLPHLSMLVHASKTFRYICECDVCSLANIDRWGEGQGRGRGSVIGENLHFII